MNSQEIEGNRDSPSLARIWQNYKISILLGGVSVLLIVISIVLLLKSIQPTTPIEFSSNQRTSSASGELQDNQNNITIDIEGAVVFPGLYNMPNGSRIDDAIDIAGGLSKDADTVLISRSINRAAKLVDGGKLYLPRLSDVNTSQGGTSLTDGVVVSSTTVNVNTASLQELDSLPGIGPVTGQKIISNRPYQTLDQLVSKKALSQSLYDKLKDRLSL